MSIDDNNVSAEVLLGFTQTSFANVQTTGRNALVWFADGSKMDAGVGIGAPGPRFQLSKFLGTTASIYQAEMAPRNASKGVFEVQEATCYQIARQY